MIKYIFIVLSLFSLSFTQNHWETSIFAGDTLKYNVPDNELNDIWNIIEFDDTNWLEGEEQTKIAGKSIIFVRLSPTFMRFLVYGLSLV